MNNLERAMKKVAAALTGGKEAEMPEQMEKICEYIAENYTGDSGGTAQIDAVEFTREGATAETCATAIAAIIANMKTAGMMKE